jgi:hypothetical protein
LLAAVHKTAVLMVDALVVEIVFSMKALVDAVLAVQELLGKEIMVAMVQILLHLIKLEAAALVRLVVILFQVLQLQELVVLDQHRLLQDRQ